MENKFKTLKLINKLNSKAQRMRIADELIYKNRDMECIFKEVTTLLKEQDYRESKQNGEAA